ncbi:hypothetical protein QUF74_07470 [Candidatus Halobeggiatoa sp. HSG11]|nr:hypothetical protein [Candidatus Halobeggiatoa sp. HSG11]
MKYNSYASKEHGGCLFRMLSSFIWTVVIITLLFTISMFGRQWYDSILVLLDYEQAVHSDNSVIKTGVHSQVKPKVTLVYKNKNGKRVRVIADAQEYSTFVNQQVTNLETAKTRLHEQTKQSLNNKLNKIFKNMSGRIDRFADWYFAYTTTYKILWEASTSATRHTLSAEATTISEAVSIDVEKYLHKHYENIVLRPELTDPELQYIYRDTIKEIHNEYVKELANMQTDFQAFVSKYTTHLETPSTSESALILDWDSQFNKMNMAEYEKGPKGAMLGAALAAGGAVSGKVVAGTAGKAVIGKAASAGIFSKLAAPFVSKAVLAGTGGAIGSLGGPIGTIIGAVGGISIDYAINEGMELTQRNTFVIDVQEAIDTTKKQWEDEMLQSLNQAINIWVEDTIQLLPNYEA